MSNLANQSPKSNSSSEISTMADRYLQHGQADRLSNEERDFLWSLRCSTKPVTAAVWTTLDRIAVKLGERRRQVA